MDPRSYRWAKQISFGYFVPDAKVEDMLVRLTEMTAPPSEKISASAFNPEGWIVSLNEQLQDWHQAYRFADNVVEVFRALDQHTRERLGLLLQNLTGARRHEVFQRYRLQLPRGFWTWQVNGVRLTVISFLAPRCPAHLTRRPAWMRQTSPDSAGSVRANAPPLLPAPSNGVPALVPSNEREDL
jgi:hypothetical protein